EYHAALLSQHADDVWRFSDTWIKKTGRLVTGRRGDWEMERQVEIESQRNTETRLKPASTFSLAPSPRHPVAPSSLPARQPQPLQSMGCGITGRGNVLVDLKAAHGLDGVTVVDAGQLAAVEAALFERPLNLKGARLVDFDVFSLFGGAQVRF